MVYPFTVTNTRTLEARFSINSYQLNVVANPAAGGSVSGSGTFQYGTQHTITATPNTAGYYVFTGWNDGNMSLSRVITVGASDATYTATFIYDPPKPQPVFCDINGSGTVKINGNLLVNGTKYAPGTYTLTAHPSSGWSSSWTSKIITITDHEIRESVTFTKNTPTEPMGSLTFFWRCSSSVSTVLEVHITGAQPNNKYYDMFHDFGVPGKSSGTVMLPPGSYNLSYDAGSYKANCNIRNVTVTDGSDQSIDVSIR